MSRHHFCRLTNTVIDVSFRNNSHRHPLCVLLLVISLIFSSFYWDSIGQICRSIRGLIWFDYSVFSLWESTLPTTSWRYWHCFVVGFCPAMSGFRLPLVLQSGCALQFHGQTESTSTLTYMWISDIMVISSLSSGRNALRLMVDTPWSFMFHVLDFFYEEKHEHNPKLTDYTLTWRGIHNHAFDFKLRLPLSRDLKLKYLIISELIISFRILLFGGLKGDSHAFMGMSERRIWSVEFVGKIDLSDYIGVIFRSMIFTRTLLQTNWHQIVTISRLVSDDMGFTSTIKKQPEDKERQKNRIGTKDSEKYYKYVYLLACKSLLIFDQSVS